MTYLVFAAFILPSIFFVVVWTTVTVCRICFPDKPLPFLEAYLPLTRWEASEEHLPMGAREIRERQRKEHQRSEAFHYVVQEPSSRVPEEWMKEMWRRRN